MSENKCPCCGCPMVEKYLGWVCPADNCAFRCPTNSLPRIAAAMKAEARHNALVEAIHKAMERTADCDKKQTDDQLIADVAYLKRLASDYFKTSIDCGNRALAAEQKYEALVEAVAWERECRLVCPFWLWDVWKSVRARHGMNYHRALEKEFDSIRDAARAEVDRLIGDCEGEP